MAKIILFFSILLLCSSFLAQGESLESVEVDAEDWVHDVGTLFEDVENWALNNQGKDLPAPVAVALNNQRLQAHLTLESGQELLLGIITENKKFSSITLSEIKDPTIDIYIGLDTLMDILSSQNAAGVFQKAMKEGTITYKAHGFFNKIKLFLLVKFAMKMASQEKETNESISKPDNRNGDKKALIPVEKKDESKSPPAAEALKELKKEEKKNESSSESAASTSLQTTLSTENVSTSQSHTVLLIDGGFEVKEVRINAGDTVIWKNEREGRYGKGMVLGTKACARMKSGFFGPGELFRWKFETSGECVAVDGIYTTKTMKVIVE